ncbi:unnamed protein product [Brugia pahangi]|uniref:MamL-1 domain-containing protein n=1 Tax=Brugia pahangi TaxID=6280 RepID=A0A0N4TUQ4_BRUPA|nr:unnamed protein product [Brugia pahangi]
MQSSTVHQEALDLQKQMRQNHERPRHQDQNNFKNQIQQQEQRLKLLKQRGVVAAKLQQQGQLLVGH